MGMRPSDLVDRVSIGTAEQTDSVYQRAPRRSDQRDRMFTVVRTFV